MSACWAPRGLVWRMRRSNLDFENLSRLRVSSSPRRGIRVQRQAILQSLFGKRILFLCLPLNTRYPSKADVLYVSSAGFYMENLLVYAPQVIKESTLPLPIGDSDKFAPIALGVRLSYYPSQSCVITLYRMSHLLQLMFFLVRENMASQTNIVDSSWFWQVCVHDWPEWWQKAKPSIEQAPC